MDLRNIQLERQKQHGKGLSLSQQLALALRQKILTRHIMADSRLPASRVLAQDLGISRNTVNSAYDQLRAEGYLRSHSGSGFFISDQLPPIDTPPEMTRAKSVHQWPPLSTYGQGLQDLARGMEPGGCASANLPFTVGLPDLRAFPVKIWQRLVRRHSDRKALMGYHSYQGYDPLRRALAVYLNISRGLSCKPEQIVITQGAQQALALCARLLIEPGDAALVEEPGYSGARKAFTSAVITT